MASAVETQASAEKILLEALAGRASPAVPFWFMRQAGRYLPEYREIRARKKGFLDLVLDPAAACEVTLQPLRRFGMDAAILFSDILVVPMALGQRLDFLEGEGPRLDPVRTESDFEKLDYARFSQSLNPIYETIRLVRASLRSEGFGSSALIGFAGAPWTVAAYMIEGGGSKDFAQAKKMMAENEPLFSKLIEAVIRASADYLCRQVEAGAECLQLFDSWAGLLDEAQFERWVIRPTKDIVRLIHMKHPHARIIGFPRGARNLYGAYVQEAGVQALGLDQGVSMAQAKNLQKALPVQGNLDPGLLLKGGAEMERSIDEILGRLAGGPFIFNLGHGINKETPIAHVEAMVRRVRDFRA